MDYQELDRYTSYELSENVILKAFDELLDFGVDKWDMCIDDYHKHSKPLAGYVGAHMICRAVYGEAPKNDPPLSVSESEISKLPVNYRRRACIVGSINPLG